MIRTLITLTFYLSTSAELFYNSYLYTTRTPGKDVIQFKYYMIRGLSLPHICYSQPTMTHYILTVGKWPFPLAYAYGTELVGSSISVLDEITFDGIFSLLVLQLV